MTYLRLPSENAPLFSWLRPCDRCGWDGFYMNQQTKEPVTNLIVCKYCYDAIPPISDPRVPKNISERPHTFY